MLAATPMTGYALSKQFEQSAAFLWHAPHSQIYPELRRMEAEGLLAGQEQPRGTRGTKRSYTLTEAGIAELQRWVTELTPLSPQRDASYLKATYYEFGSFTSARQQFRAYLSYQEQLEHRWLAHVTELDSRQTDLLKLRLANSPEHDHDAIVAYKSHVYRGMAVRARGEAQWARDGLALVDRLEAAAQARQQGNTRAAG